MEPRSENEQLKMTVREFASGLHCPGDSRCSTSALDQALASCCAQAWPAPSGRPGSKHVDSSSPETENSEISLCARSGSPIRPWADETTLANLG